MSYKESYISPRKTENIIKNDNDHFFKNINELKSNYKNLTSDNDKTRNKIYEN
jgi:hypothetical protein